MTKRKSIVLNISDKMLQEVKDLIRNGIIRKLDAARKMIEYDKEVAAGIYVYAVEELGKLQVLRNTTQIGDHYMIKYTVEFRNHEVKFEKAFNYLQQNDKEWEVREIQQGFMP